MVNIINNTIQHQNKISFKSQIEPNKPISDLNDNFVDEFIKASNALEEKRIKGNKIQKYTSSLTAGLAALKVFTAGFIPLMVMIKKNPKSAMNEIQKKAFLKKALPLYFGTIIATIGTWIGIQHWHNKNIDKETPHLTKVFNEQNIDTNAKLSKKHLRSSSIMAQYNIINGEIEYNKNFSIDPIGKTMLKKYIKHELEHARQFEMIASLDDGIKKLNYALVKSFAYNFKNDTEAVYTIKELDRILKADKNGNYDNTTIYLQGAKVNLKDYVFAVSAILDNPNLHYNDLPIIVDTKHYEEAVKKRGPLSNEEKQKAEKYYEALQVYTVPQGLEILNPFSKYKTNLLEQEARKASRRK